MSETPETLPTQFFEAGLDIHALDDLNFEDRPTVLDRLGPAHFRSKGFSFMGFLQTVYDHVAQQASGLPISEPSPEEAPMPPKVPEPLPEVDETPMDNRRGL